MKVRRPKLCGWLYLVLITFLISGPAYGQMQKRQSWDTPTGLDALIHLIPDYLDPTLPAPRLIDEPEFTWGSTNTIFWHGDSVRMLMADLGLTLLFFEVEAQIGTTVLWGYVDADQDSATFTDLPDGIPIVYRVRYFARNAAGLFEMSAWSDTEVTIQDIESPYLLLWEIPDIQRGQSIPWVESRTVDHHVVASDTSLGKIMSVVIHERSQSVNDTFFYDLDIPVSHIDLVFPYTFLSSEQENVTLNLWVQDVAGQPSEKRSEILFWWTPEERREDMVCFPNPFNPERDHIATIRVDDVDTDLVRIFDPFGNLVRVLRKQNLSRQFFEWDGRNDRGDLVANGGYICIAKGKATIYSKIAVMR